MSSDGAPPNGRDVLTRLEFILGGDLSPDGTMVVYTSLVTSAGDDRVQLRVATVGEPDATRLLEVEGSPAAPMWSPDGTSIAVVADLDGRRQVLLIDAASDEVRPLTEAPFGVRGAPAWSPDGSRVAIAFARGGRVERDLPYRVDRVPWRLDGLAEVADLLCDIVTVEVAGGEVTRLTDGPTIDVDPRWSPDGQSVLFVRSHDPDDLGPMDRHVVVDADGERDVAWVGGMAAAGAFADDERVVSICFRQTDRDRGSAADLYVSDGSGGSDNRTEGRDLQIGGSLLADIPSGIVGNGRWVGIDGDHAIVPLLVGGSAHVARVGLQGDQHIEVILDGDRACNPLALRSRTLLYASSSANDLPELIVRDLDSGHEEQVTDIAGEYPLAPLRIDPMVVPSVDGAEVDAWYVHPTTGEAPHPTVLLIHGGPFAAYGHVMNLNAQHLARSGIGVLMSNPRASLGYGTAFGTATKGAWGTLDFDDLMAVLDHAIDSGYADADRLGVCGSSYGGYMTSWTVGHTDRFAAAVAQNPVVDFRSFRGASDIGITFTDDVVGGSPLDRPEAYVDRSPITHIHRCVTPTRVIVSEHDRRVPPFQGEMLHSALLEAGCDTDMIRLPGASHSGSSLGAAAVRRAEDDAIVEWMTRHLLAED